MRPLRREHACVSERLPTHVLCPAYLKINKLTYELIISENRPAICMVNTLTQYHCDIGLHSQLCAGYTCHRNLRRVTAVCKLLTLVVAAVPLAVYCNILWWCRTHSVLDAMGAHSLSITVTSRCTQSWLHHIHTDLLPASRHSCPHSPLSVPGCSEHCNLKDLASSRKLSNHQIKYNRPNGVALTDFKSKAELEKWFNP